MNKHQLHHCQKDVVTQVECASRVQICKSQVRPPLVYVFQFRIVHMWPLRERQRIEGESDKRGEGGREGDTHLA